MSNRFRLLKCTVRQPDRGLPKEAASGAEVEDSWACMARTLLRLANKPLAPQGVSIGCGHGTGPPGDEPLVEAERVIRSTRKTLTLTGCLLIQPSTPTLVGNT